MSYEYRIVREVEFSDTDMAGIMHFANFFKFMEAAEHAFFRSLRLSIHTDDPNEVTWPRVHAGMDFSYPLRFEDSVEIRLLVREKRERSLVYSFIFRKVSGEPQREVARGTLAVACVKREIATGKMKAVPIPKAIADKIEVAPPEAFE
ncbi:MAG TPA: thioesterase family protein [Candidatus Solibacter sp.]|nr:thioesterase family protein [Candidatus Solibacter sp.]